MIFPSFFELTTVISKDDVVTSLIFTCTFLLTWTMLDNLEKWYLFPCWSPKIQLGGQIHPNSWSCRNSSNPFMQLEGFIVQLPMGSNGFQILEVDGWSGGNLRGRRTAWLSAARRVHMLIKFSKLNMTFFRYQVCNEGFAGVRLWPLEMFFLLGVLYISAPPTMRTCKVLLLMILRRKSEYLQYVIL